MLNTHLSIKAIKVKRKGKYLSMLMRKNIASHLLRLYGSTDEICKRITSMLAHHIKRHINQNSEFILYFTHLSRFQLLPNQSFDHTDDESTRKQIVINEGPSVHCVHSRHIDCFGQHPDVDCLEKK